MEIQPTYQCLQLTRRRFQRYGLILEKNWLEEDCADKNQGQLSTFAQFYLKISAGEGEIFHGYRTYKRMHTIASDPISTIWLDLGENWLEEDCADKNQGQ